MFKLLKFNEYNELIKHRLLLENNKFVIPNGWNEYKKETLPESALKFMKLKSGWRGGGQWVLSFNKNNEWIIVTNDGCYYDKCAEYMVWSETYTILAYNKKSVYDIVESIMKGEQPKN